MKDDLTVVNDERQVSPRARAPFPCEAERLSKRIAVLEQMLSVLRMAKLQTDGPNDKSQIGARACSALRPPPDRRALSDAG
jgi:hypothetical protein